MNGNLECEWIDNVLSNPYILVHGNTCRIIVSNLSYLRRIGSLLGMALVFAVITQCNIPGYRQLAPNLLFPLIEVSHEATTILLF